MKKWIFISLTAGLLAMSPSALLAQSSTNSTPNSGATTPSPKKGADRAKVLAILGMTNKDLKGMAPEDRRAKVKDAAEKKITELEQKKAAGSLTTKGQSDLDTLKKFVSHGKGKKKSDS
jgi:hypothetical protein